MQVGLPGLGAGAGGRGGRAGSPPPRSSATRSRGAPGDAALLGHRPRPQGGARHGQAPLHDRQQVQLGLGALLNADLDEAALFGQALEVAREVGRAHHVEDHVDPAAVRGLADRGHEVLAAVVDGAGGPEGQAGRAFLGRARGDEHPRPVGPGHLDGGGADARGSAVDEQGLAGLRAGRARRRWSRR